MTEPLAHRIAQIGASATLALNAKAAKLGAEGKPIVNLSVGELDFETPEHIREAAIQAIREGKTRYTPTDGTIALKKAIQAKLLRENHLSYDIDQIMVSCGAKQCIYNACQVLLNPGDEVLIPTPAWVSYADIVKLAGATPVFIPADIDHRYKIDINELEKFVTAKTRLLIFNSPSNPTGAVYSKEELTKIANLLKKHENITIISDEIYEHILWDCSFANLLNVCPELRARTLIVNGVSKAYAMTGWRIGYVAGPTEIIAAMKKIQSHSTSGPCSISQAAAEVALTSDQGFLTTFKETLAARHNYLYAALKAISGLRVIPSEATFYSFINVEPLLHNTQTDMDLANYLLEQHYLAVVPGSAFHAPGHLRLSFATDLNTLQEAVKRLKRGIDLLG